MNQNWYPTNATHAVAPFKQGCAALARVGRGRGRRWITGVRDEGKERHDRKSLEFSPLPASPETCNTHPQHSGHSPPAWMRSPQFLSLCVCVCMYVCLKFPSTVFSLCPVPLFSLTVLLLWFYPSLILSCQHLRIYLKRVLYHLFIFLSLSLSLVLFYCLTVFSCVYFYILVFFVAVDTPTLLSFMSLFFLIHPHSLCVYVVCVYVASLSCVSASSSAWLLRITLCIPIFLRHAFMSSTSMQWYELNILDSAHTEPLWSVRMSSGSQIGGSGHTPLDFPCVSVCMCVTQYLTLYHSEQQGLSHLFFLRVLLSEQGDGARSPL